MVIESDPEVVTEHLSALERAITARAHELALYLVFDRPQRIADRPGLARSFFAQRCASDAELSQIIRAFRDVGAYVELFEGELPFLKALANGRLQAMEQGIKVAYNEIEGGISVDGFQPGRKALIPTVSDAYGITCANSHAYGCALGRHKFHYFTVLRELGLRIPDTWHYRPSRGWAGAKAPRHGVKVIAKSTYENWSVGVTDASVFHVDETCDDRVATIAAEIGQPVTLQEFISGHEVGVTIFSTPELYIPPPMETVLTKAPGDTAAVMTIYDNLESRGIKMKRYEGSPDVMSELSQSAGRAFDVLELGSFARIDFRVDAEDRAWVTDVGVSPGISEKDAAFLSMVELGFDHPHFLRAVVAATLASCDQLA